MRMPRSRTILAVTLLGAGCMLLVHGARAAAVSAEHEWFRVCADPNNMPFSNRDGAGFENRLAAFVANQLGDKLLFVWQPQRGRYINQALNGDRCDAIMGVPAQLPDVATTRPYYRSTYMFVTRAARHLDIRTITDPRLHTLRVGVQLLGNDFNSPPANALGQEGVVDKVVGFPVFAYSDEPDPAARIMTAVENGQVDIAAVWGPLAGYFARKSAVPLRLLPIAGARQFAPLRFQFDIAVGVRKSDQALRARLDDILRRYQSQITAMLASYGVPLFPTGSAAPQRAHAAIAPNERRQ